MSVARKADSVRPTTVQIIMAVVVALVLATATFAATLGFVSPQGPGLGFRTANAQAKALTGELGVANDRKRVMTQIAQAKAIIARDATNVSAVRSLAILLDQVGQSAHSFQVLNLAERLSRRDGLTELALIEVAVAKGSVADALRHYDRALTTNADTAEIIMPVLVKAAAQPEITPALVRIAARRPVWWPQLVDGLIKAGDPSATARVAHALVLRPDNDLEGWRLSAVIEKLANAGDTGAALRLARQAGRDVTGKLINGDFERTSILPPFDWKLIDSEGLAAVREQRDGAEGDFALSLIASSGRTGVVARQLLLLEPGRHVLRFRAGALPGDSGARPRIAMQCIGKDGAMLATVMIDRPIVSAPITVPPNCSGQWLEISVAAGMSDIGTTPWIDNIAVDPA